MLARLADALEADARQANADPVFAHQHPPGLVAEALVALHPSRTAE